MPLLRQCLPSGLILLAIAVINQSVGFGQESDATVFRKTTFAKELGKQSEPVEPGSQYEPTSTVYLSSEIEGRPRSGKAKCKFYWKEEFIAEATVDLADVNEGVLLSIGEVTRVGFKLGHEQPLPISKRYRAELFFNDRAMGTYPFQVIPPAEAIATKVSEAILAKGQMKSIAPSHQLISSFRPTACT